MAINFMFIIFLRKTPTQFLMVLFVLFFRIRSAIFGLDKNGLNKYFIEKSGDNNLTVKFIHYFHDDSDKNSISHNEVRTICQTKNGDLWIGTFSGLNKISFAQLNENNNNDKKLKFISFLNDLNNKNSLSHNNISSLIEDRDGNLWIGTLGGGLKKFNIQSNIFTRYLPDENNTNSFPSSYVMSLYCDKKNNLWIGTYNGGLVKLEIIKEKITIFQHSDKENSISDDRIFSIQEDSEGNLWLAAFGGGINKFDIKKKTFKNFQNNLHYEKSIKNDFVR